MNQNKIPRRKMLAGLGTALGTSVVSRGYAASSLKTASKKGDADFTYCLNTSTIRGQKLDFMKELEVASEAGYDGVEIWIDGLKTYLDNGGSLKEVKNRLNDLGLTVENSIGFAQWIVDDNAVRAKAFEQAKQEMDLLAQIGCLRLAAPPAGATEQAGLDLLKAAERYHALLELGEQMGVTPQLEVWGFSKNLSRLGEVMFVAVESGHSKARILPDIYHLYRGGSDFNGLKLVSSRAIEVFHMNDYPASPAREQIDDSHRVYPGEGEAPITQVLQMLQQSGEKKVLSLELFNRDYWQQDALEVAKTGLNKMKKVVQKASNT